MLAAGAAVGAAAVARPDIIAAEERLRAAEANVGAARAAYLPVDLVDRRVWVCVYRARQSRRQRWAGVELRPFDHRADLQPRTDHGQCWQSRGRRRRSRLPTIERTVQGAFQEVSNALAGRRFLAEQVAAQERGTLAQRQIAALARTRYLEGVVSYIEVLDAERNLFAAEQALLQLRRVQVENLVALYVALGGGAGEKQ